MQDTRVPIGVSSRPQVMITPSELPTTSVAETDLGAAHMSTEVAWCEYDGKVIIVSFEIKFHNLTVREAVTMHFSKVGWKTREFIGAG